MKENQRIAVTKRMLKEGLLRLLENKQLDKIRINELCAESGINRATFYRHYETPQDVLMELELDFLKQMIPHGKQPETPREIQKQLEYACTYLYDHADIARILFRCNTNEDLMHGLNDLYHRYWELRKEQTQFSNLDDATVRVIVALLGGGCYFLLRQWILEDIPKTPEEISAIVCNIIRWPTPSDFMTA